MATNVNRIIRTTVSSNSIDSSNDSMVRIEYTTFLINNETNTALIGLCTFHIFVLYRGYMC